MSAIGLVKTLILHILTFKMFSLALGIGLGHAIVMSLMLFLVLVHGLETPLGGLGRM